MDPIDPDARWIAAHHDELVTFRRHLHAHPELSRQELETTASVAERLTVAGLDPQVLPGGCGLTCDVSVGGGGPIVALRADLDALPMDDLKDVPYRSTRPGATHACGHDAHTTIVLGAGLMLCDLAAHTGVAGTVRLLFQPAEEAMPGGALDLIEAGAMNGVEMIFGLHCDPRVDAGSIGLLAGPITSAADMMTIELDGPGGHTARPDQTVDLVALAARLVHELPAAVADDIGPGAAIVFGALNAGGAPNVIPTRATLKGTIRTPDTAIWESVADAIGRQLLVLVSEAGAGHRLDYVRGHPPVVNDPRAVDLVRDAAGSGIAAVEPAVQSVGADDFSWYLREAPGCYMRLGARPPGRTEAIDLHAGAFDIDETCIGVGTTLLAQTAIRALTDLSS
jgi:amidohydrolase